MINPSVLRALTQSAWFTTTGDAIELLAQLPPGSVDLICADPPYHLSRGGSTNSGGERVPVDKGAWDRGQGGYDAEHVWHRRWLRLAQRALAPTGSIAVFSHYDSVFSIGWAMQSLGFDVLNLITSGPPIISWLKPAPPPNLGCRQLTHATEQIVWAAPQITKPLSHWFDYDQMRDENGGKQLSDVWCFGRPTVDETKHGRHPTQKPLALVERLVRMACPLGGVICDPFMGSGTAGVAAVKQGRHFIGFDLDERWVNIARLRINDATVAT